MLQVTTPLITKYIYENRNGGELPKAALQKVYKMLSFELISQKT